MFLFAAQQPMSLSDIAVVMFCSGAGFTLQGAVGFGMGMLSSPIFILIDPKLVPGPVLASTMLFTMALTVRERRAIDLSGLRWAVIGRIAGTFPAAALLVVLPADKLSLLFGGIVLLAVALSVSGLYVAPRPLSLLTAGVVSGIMGTVAAIGGPPLALLYQRSSGARVRGTLSSLFLVGTVISVLSLMLVGRFGREELRLTCLLLPGAAFGFLVSRRFAVVLDGGYTRPAVLTVAAVAGLIVVFQYFT